MLQELSSRRRVVENLKEKAESIVMVIDNRNLTQASEDISNRYEAFVQCLSETVLANEKCLEDILLFQNNLKQFRDTMKQQWETLSSFTGLYFT